MKDNEQLLEGLKKVLKIAKANGNKLFIENIERDIKALEAGEESPIIKEYLTPEEIISSGCKD
jgi:intergrase/recombinase